MVEIILSKNQILCSTFWYHVNDDKSGSPKCPVQLLSDNYETFTQVKLTGREGL